MQKGEVAGIYIAAQAEQLPNSVTEAEAVAGKGLVGDRYWADIGTFSRHGRANEGRDVTLIAAESLAAMQDEEGTTLDGAASRRNILTRGVSLNELVGREFRIGTVLLRGVRPCPPCTHLAALTAAPVLRGIPGARGGLRADILTAGLIRVGDTIEEV